MAVLGDDCITDGSLAKEMRKFLFYSKSVAKPDGEIKENDLLRTPVGVFRILFCSKRHFAATWNHGAHENIKEGSTMNIYNEDGEKFETNVLFKDPVLDFLLLESDEKLAEDVPYISNNIIGDTHYLIMGYRDGIEKALPADALPEPSFLPGVVTCEQGDKNGHFGGTSAEMPGFSGGPAYQQLYRREFLGLCLKGAQGYQIVAGHRMESTLVYLEEFKKRALKETKEIKKTKETKETKKTKCSIL